MDKPDQNDIQQRNKALENACAVLITNLREVGGGAISIPPAPTLLSGGDLQYYASLENYHANLAGMLAGKQTKNPRSLSASTTSPERPASADSAPAALSADEVKALSWTERVQYAGGKLSAETLRARIAERSKSKDTANPKSATERICEARGAKTLADLKPQNLD